MCRETQIGRHDGERSALPGLDPRSVRRLLLIAAAIGCLWLIAPRLSILSDGLQLVSEASPPFVLLAVAFQFLSLLAQTYVVRATLLACGRISFGRVFTVLRAAAFAVLFVPSAGLSGQAVRLRHLGEQGYGVEACLLSYAIESLSQGLSLVLVITLTLMRIASVAQSAYWWVLVVLLGGILAVTAVLVSVARGLKYDSWMWRLTAAVLPAVNWLRLRTRNPAWALDYLQERLASLRSALLRIDTATQWRIMLGSIGRTLGEAFCLYCVLRSLGLDLPVTAATAVYGLSVTVGCISSAPAGLAVTESSMSALLVQQGVTLSAALAGTLLFRLINLWIPNLSGALALYSLEKHARTRVW